MENQVIHNACPTGYGLDFVILFTTLCTSVCLLGFYLRLNPQVIQCITAYTARLLSPCLAIAERAVQRVPLAWRDSANKTPQWYTVPHLGVPQSIGDSKLRDGRAPWPRRRRGKKSWRLNAVIIHVGAKRCAAQRNGKNETRIAFSLLSQRIKIASSVRAISRVSDLSLSPFATSYRVVTILPLAILLIWLRLAHSLIEKFKTPTKWK